MKLLLKAFGFSFVIHLILFWFYFTWVIYRQNQQYQELLQILQKSSAEGNGIFMAYSWTNTMYESFLWYGCITFPLVMAAYVFYKKKISTK